MNSNPTCTSATRRASLRRQVAPLALLVALVSACGGGGGGGGDTTSNLEPKGNTTWIVRWDRIAIDASGRDHTAAGAHEQTGPVRAARAMAIWAVATGDAVAAISGKFEPFLAVNPAPNADMRAAIAQAGRDALAAVFPSQVSIFDAALAEDLADIHDGAAKDAGIALGKQTAQNSIAFCQNDGSEKSEPFVAPTYVPSQDVGKWRKDPLNPNQPIVGSNWSLVRPFVLQDSAQLRLPPPPALDSPEYTAAYNEVKEVGGDGVTTPTTRTLEQSVIAVYWAYDGTPSLCAPPRLYNQMVTQIGLEKKLDVVQLTRLLALVNVAMMDAGSASWESKYYYSFWRPITGIRESDPGTGPTGQGDGNSDTQGDPSFTPLGAPASNLSGNDFTPPFPSYPSGHATFGGAIFQTMRRFFGTDDIAFTFVSDEFDGNTRDSLGNVRPLLPRSFRSLSEAEEENGQSRIYLGIHWSFDKTGGIDLGRQVGDYVFDRIYADK
jgi:hypothetical protein